MIMWVKSENIKLTANAAHSKIEKGNGNVSKRQQLDHRTDNSRRSPIGIQCSEKFPHPEASFT